MNKALKRTRGFVLASVGAFLILLFLPLAWAEADGGWISLTPGPDRNPRVNLLESNFERIEFEIQVPGISSEETTTRGGDFALLSVPSGGASNVVGQPKLPVITRMVQIPFGAEVSLKVTSFQVVEKNLEELGVTRQIAPVQPPVFKIEGAWQQVKFEMDEPYYRQNVFLPEERAKLGEIGVIRGHRFVTVLIYPLSYNPQAGRVRIYSDIKIRLTLSGSDATTTQNQLYRYASPPFEKMCGELFINYQTYESTIKSAPPLPIGYLIITLDSFYPLLADLVEWKTLKGFHVSVAQVPDIGTTKEEIKGYIEYAYDHWDIPPTYVLFVGDTDYIPSWTGSYSGTATDIEYVKMDSDYFADIFRGRLPAKNTLDANAMLYKILYYENPNLPDLVWMGAACFIASSDAGQMAEFTHRYVIQNYLIPYGMEVDSIWEALGGSTADITDCVNAGKTIVCYSGHGSTTGWACVPFNQTNVRSLSNPDEYPFVLSHACVTGRYDITECFGETWAIQPDKAGIAFWGSSANTLWDEDDILEKRMFQAAFAESCYTIGDMTDRALYLLYQFYGGGGYSKYYLDCYNIMGDPSLDLWTSPAESLFVDFPAFIAPGTNTVEITVQEPGSDPVFGALVCLYKEGEVFETGYTDDLGQLVLYPSPLTSGLVNITVTAHNHLPFMSWMEVGTPKGDVTGDGRINLGDVIFLVNYLYRSGTAPDPLDMGDVNCDGTVDVGDVVYLVNYLYQSGPPPCFD